jgi:predicted nuclease of predicted toxin-antitoxin system
MKFLADEYCDALVVRTLRNKGFDVDYMLETKSGISDNEVLRYANEHKLILITEDLDFANLAFRDIQPAYRD